MDFLTQDKISSLVALYAEGVGRNGTTKAGTGQSLPVALYAEGVGRNPLPFVLP